MGYDRHAIESSHKPEVRLAGGFRPNGAGAISALYGNWISSVVRNGAGDFTVTLKTEWANKRVVCKAVCLQLSAVADSKIVMGPYVAASRTQQLWVVTGAAAADIAANADNIVWLELVVINSNIDNGSPNHDT